MRCAAGERCDADVRRTYRPKLGLYALLVLPAVCSTSWKLFILEPIHVNNISRSAQSSRRLTRKAATELSLEGRRHTSCMHSSRRPTFAHGDFCLTSALPRLSLSFLLCRAQFWTSASSRLQRQPRRSTGETRMQSEGRRSHITSPPRNCGGILPCTVSISASRNPGLCVYLIRTAGTEEIRATQFGAPLQEGRLVGRDSKGVLRSGATQSIVPVLPMAPSTVRRYPQGSHASHANGKAGTSKRKASESKKSETENSSSRKASSEGRLKEKAQPATRTTKTKGQNANSEAATKSEESKGRTPKRARGTRDIPATTELHVKEETTSRTEGNDVSPGLDALFLEHRDKALRTGKYLGAHISAAGGPQNAPVNCLSVGGQAFAFFLKNQRRWESPPISDESAREFKEKVENFKLNGSQHILPHGSYLINLANPDSTKRKTSYDAFLDDLRRCEQLGVLRYVLHPGSTVGACDKSESLTNVARCLNEAIAATEFVTILLENMAGQKNVICSTFEDLRDIIEKIEKKDRVGVCLDTCHLFAAGFDIRTPDGFEKVMKSFDSVVGMKYLKGMHINDSKSELSSGLDRHEHLGKGNIGIDAFKFIMQHPHWFKNMPLIIETPEEGNATAVWRDEITRLYKFIPA